MNKGFPSSSAITFAIILLTTGLVNCGTIPRHVQKRIINGVDSEYVPYVTMVTGYNLHYGTFGGGSFVTLQHVLTAANLIYNMEYWYIDYGKASVGNMPYAEIHKGIHHPEYDPESFANDIGILFLNQPVDPALVQPIPLPELRNTPYENEQGKISGFGMHFLEGEWTLNQNKQTGYYRRVADDKCTNLLGPGRTIGSDSFCAWDLDYDSSICYGDLGSGMTLFIDEVNTLVGIVSVFTQQCNRDFPVIFTKVAPYVDWIKKEVFV